MLARMNQTVIPSEVRFLRLLAKRLHEYGTAAHRLENAVGAAAERLGLICDVFSSPTSVLLAFRHRSDVDEPSLIPTQLLRLSPGEIDLGRLRTVDQIAEQVADGTLDLDSGFQRLRELEQQPPVFGLAGQLLAWGLTGAAVAVLFGSGLREMLLAFPLGVLTGIFALRWGRYWQRAGSFEAIIAFIVTVAAYSATAAIGGGNVANVVVGALIVLMPGLGLTVAITELSTGHWVSGMARFAGAVVVLAKLALGVVLATQLMLALDLAAADSAPTVSMGPWVWMALLASGVAFAVLFAAQLKDYAAVVISATLSYAVNLWATNQFGAELGVFLAAFTVAAISNAFGRWFDLPSSIMRFPGIILLVPGSLGYRALSLVFSRNLTDGLEAAVSVALVLASLVGGLLIGNTLVPPRRNL